MTKGAYEHGKTGHCNYPESSEIFVKAKKNVPRYAQKNNGHGEKTRSEEPGRKLVNKA